MSNAIKIFSGIAFKSVARWLMVMSAGTIVSIVLCIIAYRQNRDLPGTEEVSFWRSLSLLITNNPWAFGLIIATPVFIFIYYLIANKVAIQSAIHFSWKGKAETYIEERVRVIVNGINNRSDWANKTSDSTLLRMKLLEAASNDPESSWMKRKIIKIAFKGIKLNDINFNDPDLRLSDVIAVRVVSFISEISEPSYLLFWLVLAAQGLLFIIAQFN